MTLLLFGSGGSTRAACNVGLNQLEPAALCSFGFFDQRYKRACDTQRFTASEKKYWAGAGHVCLQLAPPMSIWRLPLGDQPLVALAGLLACLVDRLAFWDLLACIWPDAILSTSLAVRTGAYSAGSANETAPNVSESLISPCQRSHWNEVNNNNGCLLGLQVLLHDL